jgi:hypothetical protein
MSKAYDLPVLIAASYDLGVACYYVEGQFGLGCLEFSDEIE